MTDERQEARIIIRHQHPQDVAAIRRSLIEGFPTAAEADFVEALRAADDLVLGLVVRSLV